MKIKLTEPVFNVFTIDELPRWRQDIAIEEFERLGSYGKDYTREEKIEVMRKAKVLFDMHGRVLSIIEGHIILAHHSFRYTEV